MRAYAVRSLMAAMQSPWAVDVWDRLARSGVSQVGYRLRTIPAYALLLVSRNLLFAAPACLTDPDRPRLGAPKRRCVKMAFVSCSFMSSACSAFRARLPQLCVWTKKTAPVPVRAFQRTLRTRKTPTPIKAHVLATPAFRFQRRVSKEKPRSKRMRLRECSRQKSRVCFQPRKRNGL